MSYIPEGHQGTSIHHISVVKGSTLSAYRCEILNREFMFSDQLATVIGGLYGHDIAEVLCFPTLSASLHLYECSFEYIARQILRRSQRCQSSFAVR